MAIEPCFTKELRNINPELEDAAIEAAKTAAEAIEGFEDIAPLTQHVVGIVICLDTLTDELKAACVAGEHEAIEAGIDATALEDTTKEYLKDRVGLDFE